MTTSLGNYSILNGKIAYEGNKICKPFSNMADRPYTPRHVEEILEGLLKEKHYKHLHNIDDAVFNASVDYFRSIKASWCNLPLTTRMISSPGEIYAGKKLDYTTDAMPVSLQWFDKGTIFLSESSQFYLELRLIIEGLDQVFSIYNSFRKEQVDFSHLTEFQHIEYEGKVTFEENIEIYTGLLKYVTQHIVKNNYNDLLFYLTEEEIQQLEGTFETANIQELTFSEAMAILYKELGDEKYKTPSLKNFGSFEEVALTRIVGKHCNVIQFPLEEIPFYHDESFVDENGKKFAKNADLILLGYRETVGSGQRITDIEAINKKANFFNLPSEDYAPYINLRDLGSYKTTCGFGMGWQRYTQWLLKMPYIWEMSHVPRSEHMPRP